MANIEEKLSEYHVVDQPEQPRDVTDCVSSDDTDTKEGDIEPGHNSADDDVNLEKRNALEEGHQYQHPPVEILCPRINCPEKILFCLDFSSEMNETFFRSRVGDQLSALRETKKALRMFIMNKYRINPKHEFALAVFQEDAVWVKGFSKPKDILNILDDLVCQQSFPAGDFDLTQLFHTLQENLTLPEIVGDVRFVPPPYVVRVLFIYGRSQRIPLFTDKEMHHQLEASPYFFLDVLYVHEPPSEDNKCEEIFNRLCELDHKGLSYILEAASLTRLFDSVATLLAHPLQRPLQRQADYHLATTPPDDQLV
ncbi:BRISC and BRCA1-A complex member 1-like [Babylonia areolata]|uniref:BRISC and BRCA1-A complex member 1-like n=1 Tax=Babylonia areolata TaxID=304850 RepID=UPI003FD28F5D